MPTPISLLPWAHLLENYVTWYLYPGTTSVSDAMREIDLRRLSIFTCPLLLGYSQLRETLIDFRGKKERPYFRGSVFILLESPDAGTLFSDNRDTYLAEFQKAGGRVYVWNEISPDVQRLDFKKFIQSKLDVAR